MTAYTQKYGDEVGIKSISLRGGVAQSLLPSARKSALNEAIRLGATHWAMFDDDMQFPPETIIELLKHKKDFVCANVCRKMPQNIDGVCLDFEGNRINSHMKTGLEHVYLATLACTVIKVDAFRDIPEPHFEILWAENIKNYQGEDHYFMNKLGATNVQFWCDHDLTRQINHVGDYPYRFDRLPLLHPEYVPPLPELKSLSAEQVAALQKIG